MDLWKDLATFQISTKLVVVLIYLFSFIHSYEYIQHVVIDPQVDALTRCGDHPNVVSLKDVWYNIRFPRKNGSEHVSGGRWVSPPVYDRCVPLLFFCYFEVFVKMFQALANSSNHFVFFLPSIGGDFAIMNTPGFYRL